MGTSPYWHSYTASHFPPLSHTCCPAHSQISWIWKKMQRRESKAMKKSEGKEFSRRADTLERWCRERTEAEETLTLKNYQDLNMEIWKRKDSAKCPRFQVAAVKSHFLTDCRKKTRGCNVLVKVSAFSRHECWKLKWLLPWHKTLALPSSALSFWRLITSVAQCSPKAVRRSSRA